MKKIILEYLNMIGYTILGITFGLCFFLIFINFYHYKEVNSSYIKQESDFQAEKELKDKLSLVAENAKIDVNTYRGAEDVYSISSISSRLTSCVERINSEDFDKIINDKEISMKDLYTMQQFYQTSISNECLIKQIYELSEPTNTRIQISSLPLIRPFMENHTNILMKNTDYIQKILKSNSSYSFTSNSSKNDIYDEVKDSYYELLNNYKMAVDYIYDISVWFKGVIQS